MISNEYFDITSVYGEGSFVETVDLLCELISPTRVRKRVYAPRRQLTAARRTLYKN